MSRPQNRRRSDDPTLTRSGLLSHPGTLATAGAAILFALYIFNIGGTQAFLDGLFSNADKYGKAQNDAVVGFTLDAIPYAVMALAALVVLLFCLSMRKKIIAMQRRQLYKGRSSMDVSSFTAIVKDKGVSAKVASQAYRLLRPHYDNDLRAEWSDDLRRGLKLKNGDIEILRQRMLHFTDRKNSLNDSVDDVRTVGDLLLAVEKAPHQSLTDSMAKNLGRRQSDRVPVIRTEAVGETRMVVPLHKRIQKMEENNAAAASAPATTAKKPLPPLPTPPPGANASGEMVQPLHKRRY